MDEDKKDKNYFKVPNKYKDALCQIRIPGQAGQVLDVIERFTWGWNKKEADISFKTFRERTGMDNRHIVRARNRLIQMNIITVAKKGNKKGHITEYKQIIRNGNRCQKRQGVNHHQKRQQNPLPKKMISLCQKRQRHLLKTFILKTLFLKTVK